MARDREAAALSAWGPLNAALMRCRTSADANRLLQRERDGAGRPTYVRRIAARFRRLRTQEERREELT